MNKLMQRIGKVITGMGLVTFALIMILVGMMVISHGLFVKVFSSVMESTHASAAAWALALGWEFTILITTVNVKFINRRIPLTMAICSGIIVLLFIDTFNGNQSIPDLLTRLLVGCAITIINYLFSELFHKKWLEHNRQLDYEKLINELETENDRKQEDLNSAYARLEKVNLEVIRLQEIVITLEEFKANEIKKRTCSCGKQFGTVYKLASHRASCPNKELLPQMTYQS